MSFCVPTESGTTGEKARAVEVRRIVAPSGWKARARCPESTGHARTRPGLRETQRAGERPAPFPVDRAEFTSPQAPRSARHNRLLSSGASGGSVFGGGS